MKIKLVMTDNEYEVRFIAETDGEKYLIEAISEYGYGIVTTQKTTQYFHDKKNVLTIELANSADIISRLKEKGDIEIKKGDQNGEDNREKDPGPDSQ